MQIWDAALPILGTPVEPYLATRQCSPSNTASELLDVRFHPHCPFGRNRVPAMVARMRNAVSGEPVGIHRTALRDDGSGKRDMPDGRPDRMMMGSPKGAAVMLQPAGAQLGVAEGIETALSAAIIFRQPVWSVLSASGMTNFPIVAGVEFLRIFADHDKAGLSAARACRRRYEAAGIKVEVRCPDEPGTDWNDYLRHEKRK